VCRITASPDLNTLFPASANLFATMANKINERGQISGMTIVLSGPDAGNIHAFLTGGPPLTRVYLEASLRICSGCPAPRVFCKGQVLAQVMLLARRIPSHEFRSSSPRSATFFELDPAFLFG
jgi:hypothetical protein